VAAAAAAARDSPAPLDADGHDARLDPTVVTRRHANLLLAGAVAAAAAATTAAAPTAAHAADPAVPDPSSSSSYTDPRQGYRITPPQGWDFKQKAGADALWEDPARRSSSLGVTVSPVRVASLAAFGPLDAVGTRLLDAERRKESTLSVSMLRQEERVGAGGGAGGSGTSDRAAAAAAASSSSSSQSPVRYYCYEYELNSTRGRKRILNVVTIAGSRLYIVNGQAKCDKVAEEGGEGAAAADASPPACDQGGGAVTAALEALRASAASFEVVVVQAAR
jgi:hypothetical protein